MQNVEKVNHGNKNSGISCMFQILFVLLQPIVMTVWRENN